MTTALHDKADLRAEAMFGALTDMMREFACLAGNHNHNYNHNRQIVAELNDGLSQGWMLKAEFSVGGAGPLGLSLVAVSPLGRNIEIVSFDAPPSSHPFRLFASERLP